MKIYPLVYELLHWYSTFDVGACVGLQVADVCHWNIQKPKNDVETFCIDEDGLIHPQGNNYTRDAKSD